MPRHKEFVLVIIILFYKKKKKKKLRTRKKKKRKERKKKKTPGGWILLSDLPFIAYIFTKCLSPPVLLYFCRLHFHHYGMAKSVVYTFTANGMAGCTTVAYTLTIHDMAACTMCRLHFHHLWYG